MNENILTIKMIVKQIEKIECNIFLKDQQYLESWYDIKFRVFRIISQKTGLYDTAHVYNKNKKTFFSKFASIPRKLIIFFFRNPMFIFFNKPKYLFIGHSRRKLLDDGYYWDIYTDPITQLLNENECITIERSYFGNHYRPVPTKRLMYSEAMNFYKKRMKKIVVEPSIGFIDVFKKIEQQIYDVFNINIDITNIAINKYKRNMIEESIYYNLFKFLAPEYIFIVCSYGKEAIIRAAKRLSINTIELQHGVLDSNHVGYSFVEQLPKKSFPDYFFCFSDYWKNIAKFPIKKCNIKAIGYPFFEEEKKKFAVKKDKNIVLFISQGIHGKRLSEYAVKVKKNNPNLDIIYKLHPGEIDRWKQEYDFLKDAYDKKLIKVIEGHIPPLYELFSIAQIQIGINSTALFEGLMFGCETYVLKWAGYEYMDEVIKRGFAKLVTEKKMIYKVNKCVIAENTFFRDNWQASFINALNEIN